MIPHFNIFPAKDGFWIDATDSVVEGIWDHSSTGSHILYSNWSPGNPNNDGNQDCAATVRWANFDWDDDQCYANHSFTCEKNAMTKLKYGC
ncbi:hypothetical protein KUTeg_010203 [Tegillarca granosa]|uniref:C-type lectin domain-containing protein n=1 Tax=Tegillarca granosa TaxID=220873 RepID=A0ABQ9F618_TEGGR|nr:hypothetical protein KUTeg_010203 [Tegillarca granosa]